MANLASEMVFRTTNIPLATYPAAIKAITPLIGEGKFGEAKVELQAALNTLVVTIDKIMLDTNMASYIIKSHPPEIRHRLAALPMGSITISAVTQGELLYGLARKGHPATLAKLIREFLFRVETLPWEEQAATVYGDLRASCMSVGITLGALDMMIAAHAIAANTILVTHDKAFSLVPDGILTIEDWMNEV